MQPATTALDPDDIRRRLIAAQESIGKRTSGGLVPALAHARGDHDLNPGLYPTTPLTPAAVLVPLVLRAEGTTVLLTRRTSHLTAHAGQISFPGGRLEPDDPDAAAAALRETEEEVGLPRDRVEIVGRLDTYLLARTGFEITPVVGLVNPPFVLKPDSFEVAEVFEVPLSFVLDPVNHRRDTRTDRGVERQFWTMPYGEYHIWGATAGMLVNLYEVLRP